MSVRLGPKWWDRYGHISTWGHGRPWETWGSDELGQEFKWPKVCKDCVDDDDPNGFYAELGLRSPLSPSDALASISGPTLVAEAEEEELPEAQQPATPPRS